MNFNKLKESIEKDNLILRPITEKNRDFINEMFNDTDVKRYYIVPKEAQQNYRKLVDYWFNDVKNGAGNCWIIVEKSSGFFSKEKLVGFVAFEFRDSLKNARISYAILSKFRNKGIATTSVELIIEKLKNEGVEKIEADIDRDNLNSEKVVEKLGFIANKRQALVDPEMMRDGEVRMRALWKKELVELEKSNTTVRIPLNATSSHIAPELNKIVEEINTKGQHPKLLVRYFYLLGRMKFLENNFEESTDAFGQCNMITMNEGLPDIYENFYWFGKINEAKGDTDNVKMYYGFALEKYNENPNYMTKSEIESAMNE